MTLISTTRGETVFELETSKDPHVLKVHFNHWDGFHPLGPFVDILESYAVETGLKFTEVDWIYNYKFIEDGYKIQFYWDGYNMIYIFDILKSKYQLIYDRLYRICADLNRRLAERQYFEKYGELPNNGKGFK